MPRYRFAWSNLPEYVLVELAEVLEASSIADVVETLRATYGARPQEEFIEDTWELLRETWLVEDVDARTEIVATLRERGLGEVSVSDDVEYLRSCRNTINLRRVVLPTFISLGESGGPASAASGIEKQSSATKTKQSSRTSDSQSGNLPKASTSGGLPKSTASMDDADAEDGESAEPESEQPDSSDSPDEEGNEANRVEHFRQWLLKNLREITKREHLEPDDDGDIPVDFGSARTYVSPREIQVDPKNQVLAVEIYSVLVSDIDNSPKLLNTLNRINCETPFAKLKYHASDRHVVLHHDAFAHSLNPARLAAHLGMIARLADVLDTELQREFGGELHGQDHRSDVQHV